MNKNILIISAVFPPEPVVSAKLSFDIADKLSETSKVTVLSQRPTRPYKFQFEENTVRQYPFTHIVTNSYTCPQSRLIGRLRESYSFGKHSQKFIRKNKKNIQVIYANTWPIFGQFLAVKAAKKYNIPIIIHVQDIYPESLSNKIPFLRKIINAFLLPIDKYVLKHASHVIAISDKMKSYLAQTRNIDPNKITVVNNWQDESEFIHYHTAKPAKVVANTPFTFMYLGNIGPVAGVDLLIDAFTQISSNQNMRLVIAGVGSMKESLQKKCDAMQIKNIEFWAVPEGKVPEIQDCADVLLLPIKKGAASSSIPSKLPAYMFSKKPIIACVDENSDTYHAIINADCGWVLEAENITSLSAKMVEVAAYAKNILKQKGENGFNFAIEHYSKHNNLAKIISLHSTLIN